MNRIKILIFSTLFLAASARGQECTPLRSMVASSIPAGVGDPAVLVPLLTPRLDAQLSQRFDPKKAEKGTIRADFADSIDANAVHGSDAVETAAVEIAYYFPEFNIYSR